MRNILTFVIVLITSLSFSQNKFGVFTGANYSYFTDGFAGQVLGKDSIGLQIGALYEISLNDKISFRPKIIFSQQGDRTKTEYKYGSIDLSNIDYKLNYLNFPMDFKFWNKIYFIAGPQIGFLITEKYEEVFIGKVESNIELGLNLGTGFKINKVFFEFGIYQGVSTVLNYKYQSTAKIVDVRNGLTKFTVGYNFIPITFVK
ncbi:porin family protein [Flavobacterium myungsuense]|uniref:Porin family protein n=1 Tax=Flavobacterium myungsuense TaxID=651823 RepID=A0ABW3J550_9FLAO